tara:strand:+ start:204 stop:380 length:177 start_codon:yes stop_codon:yes gene_type:complete
MTYSAEPNYIEYCHWDDSNNNAVELMKYSDENAFCNFAHNKSHKISSLNLVFGASKDK